MKNPFKRKVKETYLDDRGVLMELEKLFSQITITSETTHDEIMFNAGQRSVVKFIQTKINKRG